MRLQEIQNPIQRLRATAGAFKSVTRDRQNFRRLCNKYDASSELVAQVFDAMDSRQDSFAEESIATLRNTPIEQARVAFDAILESRAGVEKHIYDYEVLEKGECDAY